MGRSLHTLRQKPYTSRLQQYIFSPTGAAVLARGMKKETTAVTHMSRFIVPS